MTPNREPVSDAALASDLSGSVEVVALDRRFRRVGNSYGKTLREAHGGDLLRAMADDDATIAETVRRWEEAEGLEVRDWMALARDEGRELDHSVARSTGPLEPLSWRGSVRVMFEE